MKCPQTNGAKKGVGKFLGGIISAKKGDASEGEIEVAPESWFKRGRDKRAGVGGGDRDRTTGETRGERRLGGAGLKGQRLDGEVPGETPGDRRRGGRPHTWSDLATGPDNRIADQQEQTGSLSFCATDQLPTKFETRSVTIPPPVRGGGSPPQSNCLVLTHS